MMKQKKNLSLLAGLAMLATAPIAHADNQDNFGYGSKVVSNSKEGNATNYTQQYSQNTSDNYGYGSVSYADNKPSWYFIRLGGGLLIPGEATIIRNGRVDKQKSELGYNISLDAGITLNSNTIKQIDLMGRFNYGSWAGRIEGSGLPSGNKQTMDNVQGLFNFSWRPLVSDKGLISPFLGAGVGFSYLSLTQANDILLNHQYDRRATAFLGLLEVNVGFDWFFAKNFALGTEYKYQIPFGDDMEVGRGIKYTPSKNHIVSAVFTVKF